MVLLYHLMEVEMAAGRSFLVEANFRPEFANARIGALLERYAFHPGNSVPGRRPHAAGAVRSPRGVARSASGPPRPPERSGIEGRFAAGDYDDLDIGGATLRVDTTDPGAIDYAGLLAAIRANLGD